jgi:hypothetical protein
MGVLERWEDAIKSEERISPRWGICEDRAVTG